MRIIRKIFRSDVFTFLCLMGALICFAFGTSGYIDEIRREERMRTPFRSFAFQDPRMAARIQQQNEFDKITEAERNRRIALYWKSKYEDVKQKAKLQFIRGGM